MKMRKQCCNLGSKLDSSAGSKSFKGRKDGDQPKVFQFV